MRRTRVRNYHVVLWMSLGGGLLLAGQLPGEETSPARAVTEARAEKETQAAAPVKAVAKEAAKEASKGSTDDTNEFAAGERKTNLVSHDNELYVDLTREVERTQRERRKEGDLKVLQQELATRQQELTKIQEGLSKEIKKKTEENENLRLLVNLYESIKPDEVVPLLKRMPLNVTVAIMKMMSPKKSSKILAAMDPGLAAQVSRLLIQTPQVASRGGNP